MPAGGAGDGLGRVLVLPDLASVGRVETLRDLIVSLPREDIELSPTSAGVASPEPTVTFHFWVNSLGQVCGAVNPATLPSRWMPRH